MAQSNNHSKSRHFSAVFLGCHCCVIMTVMLLGDICGELKDPLSKRMTRMSVKCSTSGTHASYILLFPWPQSDLCLSSAVIRLP